MSKKYFQIYWARSSATQNGKSGFKKKHRDFFFCIFFQSTHQVGMKNFVKCYKDFFGYFNALKPDSEWWSNLFEIFFEYSKISHWFMYVY